MTKLAITEKVYLGCLLCLLAPYLSFSNIIYGGRKHVQASDFIMYVKTAIERAVLWGLQVVVVKLDLWNCFTRVYHTAIYQDVDTD